MNMISIWAFGFVFGKQEHYNQLRTWLKSSCEVPCNKYVNCGNVSRYFDPFELYRVTNCTRYWDSTRDILLGNNG